MIVIIDYNMGNVASIQNMLKRLGHTSVVITSDCQIIRKADKIILPGVGAFDYGMSNLNSLGITEVLIEKVMEDETPLLGICLGMQLLTKDSEEGTLPGLGLFNAHTLKFPSDSYGEKLKIPHMGWNYISPKVKSPLFENSSEYMRFYFVHSYYVACKDQNEVLATTEYGKEFACVIGRNNTYGVQFHPEKSHKYGMNILKNFVELQNV